MRTIIGVVILVFISVSCKQHMLPSKDKMISQLYKQAKSEEGKSGGLEEHVEKHNDGITYNYSYNYVVDAEEIALLKKITPDRKRACVERFTKNLDGDKDLLKEIFKKGIVITYIYKNPDGSEIHRFSITEKDIN